MVFLWLEAIAVSNSKAYDFLGMCFLKPFVCKAFSSRTQTRRLSSVRIRTASCEELLRQRSRVGFAQSEKSCSRVSLFACSSFLKKDELVNMCFVSFDLSLARSYLIKWAPT